MGLFFVMACLCSGGENGIRTHGMISHTHALQACPFDHSGISPYGVPGRTRTDNLLLRRQLLYPIELQVHITTQFYQEIMAK